MLTLDHVGLFIVCSGHVLCNCQHGEISRIEAWFYDRSSLNGLNLLAKESKDIIVNLPVGYGKSLMPCYRGMVSLFGSSC